MSGLRFKVGDLAIFARATESNNPKWIGTVVEIIEVGPFGPDHRHPSTGLLASLKGHDYQCKCFASIGSTYDWQLDPIKSPDVEERIEQSEEVEV